MTAIVSQTLEAMTLPFTISLSTLDKESATLLLEEVSPLILDELRRLEAKFSAFQPTSLVCRFQAGDKSVLLDAEFQEVYLKTLAAKKDSQGYFDAYYKGSYDPTGLVKGWLIEKIFKGQLRPLFRHSFIQGICFNGGGDMTFETLLGADFSWKIGIENPDNPQELLARFDMKTGSLATSGLSKRGQHLIQTQQAELKQVTMVAASLTEADIWATAAFAAGQEKLDELIKEHRLSGLYITAKKRQFFQEGDLQDV